MKKNYIILFFALIFVSTISYSQNFKEKKEQIKALKTAFITTELRLTSAEAQKFWPVYNAYDEKQFEIRQHKLKSIMSKLDLSLDTLSDKEALLLLNQMENIEDELYLSRKKLTIELKEVISPIKVLKLKKAEDDFNRHLLKQIKSRQIRN